MTGTDLLRSFGGIEDKFIDETEREPRKKPAPKLALLVAAVFGLFTNQSR